jgi:hypothetical protein
MKQLNPPPKSMMALEARAMGDLMKMCLPLVRFSLTTPVQAKRQRVLVVPGFGADDRFTWPLRKFIQSQGFEVMGWNLGTNKAGLDLPHELSDLHPRWKITPKETYRGEAGVPYVIDRLIERVDAMAALNSQPIALVGWSLGGFMAREVARERPELISQVITLGSPVTGGPKYTRAAAVFTRRQHDLDWVEQTIALRDEHPIAVPITAIVSQTDGVVGYSAALDHNSPNVQHVQMDAAHIGLPYNTEVWRTVARSLNALEVEVPLA